MKYEEIVDLMDNYPVVQGLLQAPIPARLAYVALDGSPRVIPVSYLWNGEAFVFATWTTAPKLKALAANPRVAMTIDTETFLPHILLVRGVVTMETVEGVPAEYVEASRRIVGEDRMAEWEANVRRDHTSMVLVRVTPTWIRIIDFVRTFPGGK